MAGITVSRSTVTAVAALLIGAPLCLSGCTAPPALGDINASANLRTAAGADVLAAPIAERFTADSIATGNLIGDSGEVLESGELQTHGGLTLTDGVITSADLSATAAGLPDVSFTLTQPIVLRRDGQSGEVVEAVGTLVVGPMERRDVTIHIQPSFSVDTAHIVATISLPDSLMQTLPDASRVLEVSLNLNSAS